MAAISFTGIGSGLQVTDIVNAIVDAQKVPYQSRVTRQQGAYTSDISAVGALKSALVDVQSSFDGLADIDKYQQRTISGRDDFVSLSSDSNAEVGKYSVKVEELATSHKIMSAAIDAKETLGGGTLSIKSGDSEFDVSVPDSATLSDIRDAINDSSDNSSVSATIITEASGQRLVLNSKLTGIDNGITISVAESSNKLTSASGFTATDTVGSGTLSFGSGTNNFDIAVDATDTLSDIVTAINDSTANKSVVASLVTDSAGQHLVFNATKPGVDNAVTVTAADDDGANGDTSGISQFASVNMTLPPAATNNDNTGLSQLTSSANNKLTSVNGFTSTETPGAGTLSFSSNGNDFDVTVDAFSDLSDIVKAINENSENSSVKASIFNDAAGEHLVFSSRLSGDTHAITVAAVDSDGNNSDMTGLSQFSSANQTATANIDYMTQVTAPTDAKITIDGTITVSNSTNTFKDVIDGVTITANKAHAADVADGDLSKISIAENNSNIAEGLNAFITSYNALVDLSKQLGKSGNNSDGEFESAGVLAGDSLLRGVMSKMRNQFQQGFAIGNGESLSLSDLGIRTERSGELSLEKETLDDLIESNPDKVQNFFLGENEKSGFVNSIKDFIDFYSGKDGLIEQRVSSKNSQIKKLDTDLEAFNIKMTSLEARLFAQYNAMDSLVAQLNNTGSYITQQLANMPGVVKQSN
ncbi:flagellar filament capping protein FliD [Cognaticolwellia mytili]|uniref:flagellar filament capping protein FliD n=1 Tax=Cognaticolwellia mytili TaxID=1888913 RepID=UPI000A16CDFD|nr:flagellar filament capping protein FliD [Cognaticolwellia mytili]